MSDDNSPTPAVPSPMQCKMFFGKDDTLGYRINGWLMEHPEIFIEEQETTQVGRLASADPSVVVTIWYTTD